MTLGTMLHPHLGQRAEISFSSILPISSSFRGRRIPTQFFFFCKLLNKISSTQVHAVRAILTQHKRKRRRQDNCLLRKRKHKSHTAFKLPQFAGRCNFRDFFIWSFFMWVMEKLKNQNSTEETSVSVQPLLQRPASSGSINIPPCALGSGTGKPRILRGAQPSGTGHRSSRQSSPPAAGVSPRLPTGVPGLRRGGPGNGGGASAALPALPPGGCAPDAGGTDWKWGWSRRILCLCVCVCV